MIDGEIVDVMYIKTGPLRGGFGAKKSTGRFAIRWLINLYKDINNVRVTVLFGNIAGIFESGRIPVGFKTQEPIA